ncbi:hypothetical protein HMPREF1981_00597 [Bacteroides pyogenes F0041]|uniref:Uncharacterized protein n=1 Tax=Bacteroides pyogenes F0041 TaxID=1321819 RepID=U2CVZ0_9BACE|nr:hypothetical protein HMPREF1981_00597 [Bacteroides pyogenes F0041]
MFSLQFNSTHSVTLSITISDVYTGIGNISFQRPSHTTVLSRLCQDVLSPPAYP